jgi:hypothetical protein
VLCFLSETYNPTGFCGDPHFSAPGGIFFDWHGKRDQDFAIISDTNFQVRLSADSELRSGVNEADITNFRIGRQRSYTKVYYRWSGL